MQNPLPSSYPLIQAPLAGAQNSAMTIAVCRAGGLGSLAAAMLPVEKLEQEIQTIQAACDKPFNVNFFAHTLPEITPEQNDKWLNLLDKYFNELGIDKNALPQGVLRRPFDENQLSIVEKYRPSVVSFHFGLPEKRLLDAVKATGAMVLSSATTLKEGLWLQENGADCVIAQGVEAGGHRGVFLENDLSTQMGVLPLTELLARKLRIPVIAAGGIVDTASIQAALKLGAAAVQVGTAYMLCEESTIGVLHRQALENAARLPENYPTALTNIFSGRPARGIVTRLMQETGFIHKDALPFPFAATATGALKSVAEKQGNTDFSNLWCGQNPTGCKNISAYDLTRELLAAFE